MPIRYKAVGPDRKSSCYHTAYAIGKYFNKTYTKGETIEAIRGSPGIFTFDTEKHANFFIKSHTLYHLQVIKVRGIGKGTRNIKMLRVSRLIALGIKFSRKKLFHFMKDKLSGFIMEKEEIQQHFPGTIAYQSVEVLE